jgi:hypothetical protein
MIHIVNVAAVAASFTTAGRAGFRSLAIAVGGGLGAAGAGLGIGVIACL